MAEFILTSSGFINLDHVLLVRVGIEKEEGKDLIQMSDGRIVQCVIHDRSFLSKPPLNTEAAAVGFGEPDPKPKYDDGGGENRSMTMGSLSRSETHVPPALAPEPDPAAKTEV